MSHPRPAIRVLAVLELLQAHGRMAGAELAARLQIDARTLRRYIVALEELGIPIVTERGRNGGYALMAGYKLRTAAFGSNAALMTLSSAAQLQQRVRIDYEGSQGCSTQRDFDPYGLSFQNGFWYAAGLCHLRKEMRSFRLDRIRRLHPLEQQFTRPSGFDVMQHLRSSLATLKRVHAVEVMLHSALPEARLAVPDWLGILEDKDGKIHLRCEADDLDWVARQLAQLPMRFTIVRPVALRNAVRRLARRLLDED